jgi:hypothetical protein
MKHFQSLLLCACLVPLPACILAIGGGDAGGAGWWRHDFDDAGRCIDGFELEHHHRETLALDVVPDGGLSIAVDCGDIEIERAGNASTLEVEVWEATPGDAYAVVEGGRLVVRTKSGQPCSIGDVELRTHLTLPSLEACTGMGDIVHDAVPVADRLALSTGMGDVCASGFAGEACVVLDTGMGDVCLHDASARSVKVSSGMGDVLVEGSTLEALEAQSGMGDVRVARTSCPSPKLSSSMGDVEID